MIIRNTTASGDFTFPAGLNVIGTILIGGGFGSGGVTISDGSVWIAGSLYILGNMTNINVTNLNTNGSLIPTVTETFGLGNSTDGITYTSPA